MTPAEGAQWAVGRGFAVLALWWPLEGRCACGRQCGGHAAKHPIEALAPRGVYSASVEAAARYWHSAAAPYNIGIALGSPSGVIAFDVDPRDGGHTSLAKLERELGPLPRTLRIETGRGDGGQHLYFCDPNVGLHGAAGLQVKARGGYVVGPGSRHIAGGSYRIVVDAEVAELPRRWVERLRCESGSHNGIQVGGDNGVTHTPGFLCVDAKLTPTRHSWVRRDVVFNKLRSTLPGTRGKTLNWASMVYGNMVAEYKLSLLLAERLLIDACKENGLWAFDGERAVRREIERGLTYGIEQWRAAEKAAPAALTDIRLDDLPSEPEPAP